MNCGNQTQLGRGSKRVIHIGSTAVLVLALSACGTARKVTTAVTTIGGAATTAVTTAGGAVGSAAKTATTLGSSRSVGTTTASGAGVSAGGELSPAIATGTLASSTGSNTGERSDTANQAIGAQISKKIIAGVLFCTNIETTEYRIDCFADQLDQVAETVPDDDDFAQARSIISNAAAKLSGVAQSRSSRTLRPVTLTSSNVAGTGSSRPVVAVKSDEIPAALAEAGLVLQEAETLLLRSSETSLRRKLPYGDIAEAIGSTKVLLRSI